MFQRSYETVFILTPVLSDTQMKDAVEKFKDVLKKLNAEIVHEENWGLKKLAYPIQKKSTGFYNLLQFSGDASIVSTLETEFRRDEKVMRFMTITLDKFAQEYAEKRRKGAFGKKDVVIEAPKSKKKVKQSEEE